MSYNLLQEAQENVAKIAYQELCRRYENIEKTILPVTGDKHKIISRVTEVSSNSKYLYFEILTKVKTEETAYRNDGSNKKLSNFLNKELIKKLYTAYCICDIAR